MRPLTRIVLAVGVVLTAPTGLGLYVRAADTTDFWAWTIRAPLTAALLGACFFAASVGLALGLRAPGWERARPILAVAISLTSLSLLVTLRHLDELRFHDPAALPRLVAWTWLLVYVALPPLALAAFVLEERRARPARAARPLRRASTSALGAAGAALAVLGVLGMVEWDTLARAWPWPLPPIASSILGAWLLTFGVGLLWVVFRERNVSAVRMGAVPMLVLCGLELGAAVRFRDDFDGGWAIPFAGVVAVLAAVVAAVVAIEADSTA